MKASIALVVAIVGVAAVLALNPSPTPTPSIPSPIVSTDVQSVMIDKGGESTFPPGQLSPGDKVTCAAGGVGGTVQTPGMGSGSSSGFSTWTDKDGTVHVKCPYHGELVGNA